MLKLFTVFVLQAGSLLGVRIDGVVVDNHYCQNTGACVAHCSMQGFQCDQIVVVTDSELMNDDLRGMKKLALHEVCHLKNGDHYVWAELERAKNKKALKERHKAVDRCIKENLWRMK